MSRSLGPVGLHGHGSRKRIQLGPAGTGERPEHASLRLRRYACQRCGAIVVAAPRDLVPRLRYRAVSVVPALGASSRHNAPEHDGGLDLAGLAPVTFSVIRMQAGHAADAPSPGRSLPHPCISSNKSARAITLVPTTAHHAT